MKTRDGRYYVKCDDKAFQVGLKDHMYMPGYDVPLIFPVTSDKQSYTFEVESADSFTAEYYAGTGYLVKFQMPENPVKVSYTAHDCDVLKEADGEISFVFDENPSTGFLWEYQISEEGVVEVVEDQYVNDPIDPADPVSGRGGTHFFKFRTTGEGIVEIRLQRMRGDEKSDDVTYRYDCDGSHAVLIETINEMVKES